MRNLIYYLTRLQYPSAFTVAADMNVTTPFIASALEGSIDLMDALATLEVT